MAENNYLSIAEWSTKYGKSRTVTLRQIHDGRIPAIKIGSQWAIPADVEPPPDKRIKSGKYKNWRKPKD